MRTRTCARRIGQGQSSPNVPIFNARSHMKAPDEINVYSAGSLANSRNPTWGLLGAGAWWPGRRLEENPMSAMEREAANEEQEDKGVRLYTALGGFGGSSTRSEIAAGILAVAADGAVHVGSDSRAFLDKANKIIQMSRDKRAPRRSSQFFAPRSSGLSPRNPASLPPHSPVSFVCVRAAVRVCVRPSVRPSVSCSIPRIK